MAILSGNQIGSGGGGGGASEAYVDAAINSAISNLVNAAPSTLDQLNELANAIGNDPNFSVTLSNALATKQPLDATLTAIAGVTSAADTMVYFTDVDTVATTTVTSFARTLLDDLNNTAARTTLGLGTIATQDSNAVSITGGSISGVTLSLSSPLAVTSGGTGASTASSARTNLGLGTIATQNSNAVSVTGGTLTGVSVTASALTVNNTQLNFTGTNTGIIGLFDHSALPASRTLIKTSGAAGTVLTAVPNTTNVPVGYEALDSYSGYNNSAAAGISIESGIATLYTKKYGFGNNPLLRFLSDSTTAGYIFNTGRWGFGSTANDDGSSIINVSGNANIKGNLVFTSSGTTRYITGDLSSAQALTFRTSTADSPTKVFMQPNGGGVISSLSFKSSDTTFQTDLLTIGTSSTGNYGVIESSGTIYSIRFKAGGTEYGGVFNGGWAFGANATAQNGHTVQVYGTQYNSDRMFVGTTTDAGTSYKWQMAFAGTSLARIKNTTTGDEITWGVDATSPAITSSTTSPIRLIVDYVDVVKFNKTSTDFVANNGYRIFADFTNPIYSSRTSFMSNVANGMSYVNIAPNGTNNNAAVAVFNQSGMSNGTAMLLGTSSSANFIDSADIGFNAALPIEYRMKGVSYGKLFTTGRWGFGSAATDDGSSTVSIAGNLSLQGVSRIIGDFSNATLANRTYFTTSTTNGDTVVGALPNGTSNISKFIAFSSNDPANSYYLSIKTESGRVALESGITGTGTLQHLEYQISGTTYGWLYKTGRWGFGSSATDDGSSVLNVAGDTNIQGTSRRFKADFSNGTASARCSFVSTTSNGNTYVNAIPNGTSQSAGWVGYSSSDADNSSLLTFGFSANSAIINSGFTGTGSAKDINFRITGTTFGVLYNTGRWGFGTGVVDDGSSVINVVGNVNITGDYKVNGNPLPFKYTIVNTNTNVITVEGYARYGVNTTVSSVTMTLPATPAAGDTIDFVDSHDSWGTNKLVLARNGSTIEGLAEDLEITVDNRNFSIFYNGTTWRVAR